MIPSTMGYYDEYGDAPQSWKDLNSMSAIMQGNGRSNNKTWSPSSNTLVKIGEPGMRESAIAFGNSLDDAYPGDWGGTKPWSAIQAAFNDSEVDTLYLLSDGQPNNDLWGGSWNSNDHN